MSSDTHTHIIFINDYYSALKKEGNPATHNNNGEPEDVLLSEISQSQKTNTA